MVNKKLIFSGVLVVCASLIGYTALLSKADETNHHRGHQHQKKDSTQHNSGHHHHKKVEIPAGEPTPSVDLVIYKDTKNGWNLQIKTNNFVFAPEKVNQDSKITEGHGHLFVNGKKITRIYSPWYYLDNLPPGENKITVTLNTNKHEDLFYQGQRIEDTETITVER